MKTGNETTIELTREKIQFKINRGIQASILPKQTNEVTKRSILKVELTTYDGAKPN